MPTLSANTNRLTTSFRRTDVETYVDWPVLMGGYLLTDDESEPVNTQPEYPTTSFSATLVLTPYGGESSQVRRAVRRAISEFGPALDRLGGV